MENRDDWNEGLKIVQGRAVQSPGLAPPTEQAGQQGPTVGQCQHLLIRGGRLLRPEEGFAIGARETRGLSQSGTMTV